MPMISKFLKRVSIPFCYDDGDAALIVVLEAFLKSNCKLSQLNVSGSDHYKIKHCISKAKDVTDIELTDITMKNIFINDKILDLIIMKVW